MVWYSLACLSDTGVAREHNEDNIAFLTSVLPVNHQSSELLSENVPDTQSFAVGVFDGMGGETAGGVASYVAAKAFSDVAVCESWSAEAMLTVIEHMDAEVCVERDCQRASTMGTTATLLAVDANRAFIANVGDSPAFLWRSHELKRMSREHTDAEMLKLLGIEGRKPGLTQFLGMSDGDIGISPHVIDFELVAGDIVLLASDGLTDALNEEDISVILARDEDVSTKASELITCAIEGGSRDNVTVLLCSVMDGSKDKTTDGEGHD